MAKVLIVDDDRDVRESMAKILRRAGHEVTLAESGAAGTEAIGRDGADIIITDIIMPAQNGVDFIRQLRSSGCTTPILAISGGGNLAPEGYLPQAITTTAYLAAAEKYGANATLTKPFGRQELLDIVNSVLAR